MTKLAYNLKEAAEALGISPHAVTALTKSGQLSTIKIGRSVRISATALADFANTGTKNRTVRGTPLDPLWQGKRAAQ